MVRECTVELAGEPVRYLEGGAGWPVLLIHAFPLNADMWRPQIERAPDGWRLIAPDLRGFGSWSSSVHPTPSMDAFAADLASLLDVLEIERAVIGGESMGGYITFALLRKWPERFSGVLLASTRAAADNAEGLEGRRKMSELVRSSGPGAVADQMLPKLLGATSMRERPHLTGQVRAMIERNSPEGIDAAIHAMMRRPDSTPMLAGITVPALVVAGEEDTIIPVKEADTLGRSIPRSRLVVLPGAGHLSNLEAPEQFSLAVADFLESNL
jgi:3-oxoadipate enol-lactonase